MTPRGRPLRLICALRALEESRVAESRLELGDSSVQPIEAFETRKNQPWIHDSLMDLTIGNYNLIVKKDFGFYLTNDRFLLLHISAAGKQRVGNLTLSERLWNCKKTFHKGGEIPDTKNWEFHLLWPRSCSRSAQIHWIKFSESCLLIIGCARNIPFRMLALLRAYYIYI